MPKPPSPPAARAFAWRSLFHESATAVFVVGDRRQMRYANPAWERLTGAALKSLRGTRFSDTRESASPLWKSLAPPSEVWTGRTTRTRKPTAGSDDGPPWWDVTFVPLLKADGTVSAVVCTVVVVGDSDPTPAAFTPASVAAARATVAARFTLDTLDGPSPLSARLVSQVKLAADTSAPVWLVGEPGTGKETVARVIHHAGPRRELAFLALECAALHPYLIDGILSGKGGLAGGPHVGTLLLKNPAGLHRDVQQRLLDWVASDAGPRLICASTAPAAEGVRAGKLLPAFHTHWSALELLVPPLRDRVEDLPRLVDRIAERFASQVTFADDVLPLLAGYRWPGNVRELADAIGSAVEAADGKTVARDHFPRFIREAVLLAALPTHAPKAVNLDAVLEAVERRLIRLALAQSKGHITAAAERLGVYRTRLARRIEALGIEG